VLQPLKELVVASCARPQLTSLNAALIANAFARLSYFDPHLFRHLGNQARALARRVRLVRGEGRGVST
jgi:hypothetical protein